MRTPVEISPVEAVDPSTIRFRRNALGINLMMNSQQAGQLVDVWSRIFVVFDPVVRWFGGYCEGG